MTRQGPGNSGGGTGPRLVRLLVPTWLAISGAACVTVVPPNPAMMATLGPRDTIALAHETGRRDGLIMHPSPPTYLFTGLIVPAGMVVAANTQEPWAMPATIMGMQAGVVLWSYRRSRAPVPVPPDSMRERYGLESERAWRSYRTGFTGVIEERRRAEFVRHVQSAVLFVAILGAFMASSPRYR